MATTVSERTPTAVIEGDQCVVLHDIDWKGYCTMLRLRGERRLPRMIYCDGELVLVSPSYIHELLAERLGLFVAVVVEELDIPCKIAGSTTLRRRKKDVGVEGDKTFYLSNAHKVAGKDEIDLRTDPPPDLAIEAVHTHEVATALKVYRRLRVPEVWVCDEEGLRILVRRANGRYSTSESSAAFPYLKGTEIFARVSGSVSELETGWLKDLRRWVRDVLIPRRAGGQP